MLLEHESRIDMAKKRSLVSVNLTEGNFRANDSFQPSNSNLQGQVHLASETANNHTARWGGCGFGRHNLGGRSFGRGGGGRDHFVDVQCQVCHKWWELCCYYSYGFQSYGFHCFFLCCFDCGFSCCFYNYSSTSSAVPSVLDSLLNLNTCCHHSLPILNCIQLSCPTHYPIMCLQVPHLRLLLRLILPALLSLLHRAGILTLVHLTMSPICPKTFSS